MLSLLSLEYEWIKVDLLKAEQKSPEFLALNPFGQVPLLMDGEVQLADAQAILNLRGTPATPLLAVGGEGDRSDE